MIYLKMVHQLLGLHFDDDVVLCKFSFQHLLVGQSKYGLTLGANSDMDGKLLHISP